MRLVLKSRTIRPWRLDDTESLAKHANNRKIWLGLRDLSPHSYTSDDAHKFLQKAMDAEPVTNFCIEVEGPATGGDRLSPRAGCASAYGDAWYCLGEDFWGRGIMTEAVAAFTDFCFGNFSLRRISAEVFANNPGVGSCSRESRLRFRRLPQEQRHQRRKASRFTALSEDEVEN